MANTDTGYTVVNALATTEAVFGMVANSFVLAAVMCSGKMRRSAMNLLIANLALADFLLLLIYTTTNYFMHTSSTRLVALADWHCMFSLYIRDTCWEATTVTFVAIAVERWLS